MPRIIHKGSIIKKPSAGILVYKKHDDTVKVLLGHPGGPYWVGKDSNSWSIPKGEYDADEQPFAAAQREFREEIGSPAPNGEMIDLGDVKRSDGKVIHVWAIEGDVDVSNIVSNTFSLEWPPKSGNIQQFPEIDKAAWFDLAAASKKIHKGQGVFLQRLAEALGIEIKDNSTSDSGLSEQSSLF